jgi:hypothetical protein
VKLNDTHIHAKGDDGTEFYYKATTTVTKEGKFSVELDERLAEIADRLHKTSTGIGIDYGYKKHWVKSQKLADAAAFIRLCAEDFLKCEVTTKRVIVYGHILNIHFWKDENGEVHPNGCKQDGGTLKGGWFKGSRELTSTEEREFYTVGFAARVMDKITYHRTSGDTLKYEYVRKSDDECTNLLNSFVRLTVDPTMEQYKEMPYSPEATKFFYGVIINMCKLADQLQTFFGDDAKVLQAIHSGKLLKF